ncbi:hypothetical protein BCO_0900141 (plasmid) [Borrelia coriaceae ATCC 43381]|uniref:Uncharacterized protein n=1 Tax=Borrelia coriaceae ATCC 43381 TaxID=1408429 RepID=W5T3C2_9SPIR|nr:hypothetical protein BCO_0900141 [Borrelia coriaceae ATCC 43381]
MFFQKEGQVTLLLLALLKVRKSKVFLFIIQVLKAY